MIHIWKFPCSNFRRSLKILQKLVATSKISLNETSHSIITRRKRSERRSFFRSTEVSRSSYNGRRGVYVKASNYFVKSSNALWTHVRDRFSWHVFQSSVRSPVKLSHLIPFSYKNRVKKEEYFYEQRWNNSTHDLWTNANEI